MKGLPPKGVEPFDGIQGPERVERAFRYGVSFIFYPFLPVGRDPALKGGDEGEGLESALAKGFSV
jgi:hypothetical protein